LVSFDVLSEVATNRENGERSSIPSEFIPFREKYSRPDHGGADDPDSSYHRDWFTSDESYLDESPVSISASGSTSHHQHDGCQTCWIADGWVMEYQGDYVVAHAMHRDDATGDTTGLWKKVFYARIQICIEEKTEDDMDLGQFMFVEA